MITIKSLVVFLFSFFALSSIFSQTTDEELAYYYYNNGDFDKAKLYLEKLYQKNSNNQHYTYYINTLLELKECSTAESVAKKQAKDYPRSTMYMIGVGTVYDKCGDRTKALKYYQKLIDDLDKNSLYGDFSSLGSEFTRLNELDLALQTYIKGQKIFETSHLNFTAAIADIYGRQGKYSEMIDQYLNLIEQNEGQLANIQTRITVTIDFEKDNNPREELRVKLLKKIQEKPTLTIFNRMLIWYFEQTNNWESAFIQVKALDKRRDAQGEEVYRFATLCESNKKYDLAIESYEHVLTNFTEANYYYKAAKSQILYVLNKKITENLDFTEVDLVKLEKRYIETIIEITNYREKTNLVLDFAHLEIYFLHKLDTAQLLLDEVLSYPGLDNVSLGKAKIAKADLLLIKNEVWEASLLYMQVEKMFKEDVLGHEAKLKNAKLYYYTGDYEWCQNQLNSLKASTSKLISNDAIDLSLLITDNYNMDTTIVQMKRFSEADLLIIQNKYSEALKKLDSINIDAPNHSLSDEILYKRYQIAYAKKNFEEAKGYLEEIVKLYSEDILADNAFFYLAELYEKNLNKPEKAKEMYETLLFNYPGSLFVVEARKRYREYSTEPIKINTQE